MDCYLKDRDKLQLSSWFGKECHLKLLYKISRDGGSPQTIHNLCDNKGPTVTIFYNTDNNVYGGYLSDSWRSTGSWCADKSSFLFQLYSNFKWQPNMFPLIKEKKFNVFFAANHGPAFDNLLSFEGDIQKTSNYYEMNTEKLFDGSYYVTGSANPKSIANGHNNVADLEVYLVKDGPAEPWREPPVWASKFNPAAPATKDTPVFVKEPTIKDRIYTVAFVIDSSNVEVMPDGIIKKLKNIKDMLIEREVPLLVLVTKIDKVCRDVDKDVEEVFFSNAVKKTVDKVSDVIAIPRSHVLPVKNYEEERTLQNDISILAMEALKQVLLFCQDFLENQS